MIEKAINAAKEFDENIKEQELDIRDTEDYKRKYNDKKLWFNKFCFKIETLDGMYYTIQSWNKDEIVRLWIYMENNAHGVSLDEVIAEMEKRGCEYIMGYTDLNVAGKVKDGLLYLQEEHKIINKNQIKETLIQMI